MLLGPLLLCYNIPLAEWLQSQIPEENLPVILRHFHGLSEDYVRLARLDFCVPDEAQLSLGRLVHAEVVMLAYRYMMLIFVIFTIYLLKRRTHRERPFGISTSFIPMLWFWNAIRFGDCISTPNTAHV